MGTHTNRWMSTSSSQAALFSFHKLHENIDMLSQIQLANTELKFSHNFKQCDDGVVHKISWYTKDPSMSPTYNPQSLSHR